jgi:hypothetical protein
VLHTAQSSLTSQHAAVQVGHVSVGSWYAAARLAVGTCSVAAQPGVMTIKRRD